MNENMKKIEYKYVLSCKINERLVPVRWEAGDNRQIICSEKLTFSNFFLLKFYFNT